jgi:hypothetical protein
MNNKPPIQASNLSLRNKDATLVERQESESLRHYLQAAMSDNTRKAYRSAIRQFEKWGGRLPSDRVLSCTICWPEPNHSIPEPWICT